MKSFQMLMEAGALLNSCFYCGDYSLQTRCYEVLFSSQADRFGWTRTWSRIPITDLVLEPRIESY